LSWFYAAAINRAAACLNTACHGQPLERCSTIRRTATPTTPRIGDARGEPFDKFERALLGFPQRQRPTAGGNLPAVEVSDDRLVAEYRKANGTGRRNVGTVCCSEKPLGL